MNTKRSNSVAVAQVTMHSNVVKPDLTKRYLPLPRSEVMTETLRLIELDGRPLLAIAELADISNGTINKWIDGTTAHARLPLLEKVLAILGYELVLVKRKDWH